MNNMSIPMILDCQSSITKPLIPIIDNQTTPIIDNQTTPISVGSESIPIVSCFDTIKNLKLKNPLNISTAYLNINSI